MFGRVIVLVGILVVSMTSCNPANKYKSEISEIDSCLAVLDTIESNFDGINFDSLAIIVEHVNANEIFIKNNYVSDTVNQVLGKNLNQCKGIRKFFVSPQNVRNKYKGEILDLNEQFENLKLDILNGILEDEKMHKYISTEESDLNIFNLGFTEYYEKSKLAFDVYYNVVPQIDVFIEELMAKDEKLIE